MRRTTRNSGSEDAAGRDGSIRPRRTSSGRRQGDPHRAPALSGRGPDGDGCRSAIRAAHRGMRRGPAPVPAVAGISIRSASGATDMEQGHDRTAGSVLAGPAPIRKGTPKAMEGFSALAPGSDCSPCAGHPYQLADGCRNKHHRVLRALCGRPRARRAQAGADPAANRRDGRPRGLHGGRAGHGPWDEGDPGFGRLCRDGFRPLMAAPPAPIVRT